MMRVFHRLKVSHKLMLISFFFMIPDSVLLCLFLVSINANIRFARWEQYGNAYQRPLESLLEHLSDHALLLQEAGTAGQPERQSMERRIDSELGQLERTDAQLGEKLQFTDEGLAKRKREHFRVQNLRREWEELKAGLGALDPRTVSERHAHLIGDVRTMITHAGDSSNLILDPDLDSYYLMDVTLLALPEMQNRLAEVTAYGSEALRRSWTRKDQSQLAVFAALLKDSDLDRVLASANTALNEDPNFYGTSPGLAKHLTPALQEFETAAKEFIRLTQRCSDQETPDVTAATFLAAGGRARRASFALWAVAARELDILLELRMEDYEARRSRSLILTALALLAAVSLVAFITHSISGPLQRHAAQMEASNQALQAEVRERQRAESALRAAEEKYRGIFENAVEGIFQSTPDGRYLVANPTLARMYGYGTVAELQEGMTDIGARLYVDPNRRAEFQRQIATTGTLHRFESEIFRRDGSVIWISEHARAVRDPQGVLQYYEGTVEDITERKRNEAELQKVNRELMDASRRAGMAEVATGVLHNVGNVLNSVNVSANFVTDRLRRSKASNLGKAVALLRAHAADPGAFLTQDPRGRQLPDYLHELSAHLLREQQVLVEKMELLGQHLEHIKEIVAMQQTHAKASGVAETIKVTELLEDALRLNAGELQRREIEIQRDYAAHPTIVIDKHKVLQILVNLIRNSESACHDSERPDKRIVFRVDHGPEGVQIAVSDNGVGIPEENLTRIFNHGFTTRRDGHGFGLHSGALAARELGGALRVQSEGQGRGATFTLQLPVEPPRKLHA